MVISALGHSSTVHISLLPTRHAARWRNHPYHMSPQHRHAMCIRRPGGRARCSTLARCSLGVAAVDAQNWTALVLISVTGHVSTVHIACCQYCARQHALTGGICLTCDRESIVIHPLSAKFAVTLAQALERQPWIGRVASAPILVMAVAALASAVHAIPRTCGAYDLVWSALMPFGAALCLLEVDLTDLARCLEQLPYVQVWEQPAGCHCRLLRVGSFNTC
jgi:hypothetical protein